MFSDKRDQEIAGQLLSRIDLGGSYLFVWRCILREFFLCQVTGDNRLSTLPRISSAKFLGTAFFLDNE